MPLPPPPASSRPLALPAASSSCPALIGSPRRPSPRLPALIGQRSVCSASRPLRLAQPSRPIRARRPLRAASGGGLASRLEAAPRRLAEPRGEPRSDWTNPCRVGGDTPFRPSPHHPSTPPSLPLACREGTGEGKGRDVSARPRPPFCRGAAEPSAHRPRPRAPLRPQAAPR